MILIPSSLKRFLYGIRQRQRFPRSIIHSGVCIDPSSMLGDFTVLFRNTQLVSSRLGAYTYVQQNSFLYNVELGPFCSVAGNVVIGLASHPTIMVSTSPVFYDITQPLPRFFSDGKYYHDKLPRTHIDADVWIGEAVKILAGVRIGVGTVIGAGAVVTKDLPPYVIAAGIPCRTLRPRFDDAVCRGLLASRWWEFSDHKLMALSPYFRDPKVFLEKLKDFNG